MQSCIICKLSLFLKMSQVEYLRSQQDEILALQNIYLDQLQLIKESAPHKFTILCKPYGVNQHEFQLNIMFQYSKQYPKTPLKYQFQALSGITRDNLLAISQKIQQVMFDNANQPIVYDIVQQTRGWIQQFLVSGKVYETEEVSYVKKNQHFEKPKFETFTPVTVETFLAWKKQFQLRQKMNKEVKKQKEQPKPSGKQWFLGKHGEQIESQQQDEQDEQQDEQPVVIPTQENNDLFDA